MQLAFIDQTKRDLANVRFEIAQIKAGLIRPHRDGIDRTAEAMADLLRREAQAEAILSAHA